VADEVARGTEDKEAKNEEALFGGAAANGVYILAGRQRAASRAVRNETCRGWRLETFFLPVNEEGAMAERQIGPAGYWKRTGCGRGGETEV
jgi:hypothetical protein